jgi:hypothetical protein
VSAAQVHQATLSKDDQMAATLHRVALNLHSGNTPA